MTNPIETFDAFFKHKIGDKIMCRSQFTGIKLDAEINPKTGQYGGSLRVTVPGGDTILERLLQQCHGGVQGFYLVRREKPDGSEIMARFCDLEVVGFDEVEAFMRSHAAALAAAAKPDKEFK